MYDNLKLVFQIYELESEYCGQAECTAFGTVTKGFEGFLTSKNAQVRNKGRTFRVDERVFSLSSATSQGVRVKYMTCCAFVFVFIVIHGYCRQQSIRFKRKWRRHSRNGVGDQGM